MTRMMGMMMMMMMTTRKIGIARIVGASWVLLSGAVDADADDDYGSNLFCCGKETLVVWWWWWLWLWWWFASRG